MKKKEYFLVIILSISLFHGFAQNVDYPYADEIRKFKALDSISPPPQNAILFAGSSSFRLWEDVQNYFPGYTIINRGFGGSSLSDMIRYTNDIIVPYHPKQIVIYCGENDFAASDTITSAIVNIRFVQLFTSIRKQLPQAKITYVSIKASPSRWRLKEKIIATNKFIRKFLRRQPNTSFVDVWSPMLGKDKLPLKGIFLEDQLHMNPAGYKIWQKAIKPYLIK